MTVAGTTDDDGWAGAFEALESCLVAASVALDGGDPERAASLVGALRVPGDLPPLPPRHGDRARRALDAVQDLTEQLTLLRDRTGRSLSVTSRRTTPARAVPHFIDHRG